MMTLAELKYGQKILVAYTGLDGLENSVVVEAHWLKSIHQVKAKKLAFKKKFPFVYRKAIEFTDVVMNAGTEMFPKWMHIYALESPRLMAKKFGIVYSDLDVERINDDLGVQ